MPGSSSDISSVSPTDGPYFPARTLDNSRPENGLARPGDRSRPTPRRLASLVVADAFVGALTLGSIRTFPATAETENTASYQGGAWLGGPGFEPGLTESGL